MDYFQPVGCLVSESDMEEFCIELCNVYFSSNNVLNLHVNKVLTSNLVWIHFKRVVIGNSTVRTKNHVASNQQKEIGNLK